MDIEIIGAESLGVRSLCCFVKTKDKKILIDPGIALGYTRYGLLPHPLQVAVGERIQRKILKRWSEATDIVFSHYHGDHIPLVDANPYQLNINKVANLNADANIWTKNPSLLSQTQKKRANALVCVLKNKIVEPKGNTHGALEFSKPVFHGDKNSNMGTVMMTRIEEDYVFVHGSDIQLLTDEATSEILHWKPDILIVSGPPLYLVNRVSKHQINKAWHNAELLSQKIDGLILDHHLMRNFEGIKWLKRLSSKTGKEVICSADFMKKPRMLLEARRKELYTEMPVPDGWHKDYAKGKENTDKYWDLAKGLYNSVRLSEEK